MLAFDTPTPPARCPAAPFPPLIVPPDWLVSVVIAQVRASTPSPPGPPVMLPLPVTVMAPPLLRTGPVLDVEMVRFEPRARRERPIRRGQGAEGDERSAREQRSARNPRAAAECRDVGKAFNLASARAPPAFLHAHDAAPEIKACFYMELKRVSALQQGFVSYRKTQFTIDRIGRRCSALRNNLARACRNRLKIR